MEFTGIDTLYDAMEKVLESLSEKEINQIHGFVDDVRDLMIKHRAGTVEEAEFMTLINDNLLHYLKREYNYDDELQAWEQQKLDEKRGK